MATTFLPAETIDDAYNACNPELPLEPDDNRYVDLTPVRGSQNLVSIISRRIRRTKPPLFHKQLITGHRGCGKSTDLKQLRQQLHQQRFFTVYCDVETELDPGDMSYLDVLVVLARTITEGVQSANVAIPHGLMAELDDWFADRLLTDEEKKDVEGTLKAEFAIEPKIPLLTRMLLAFTGQVRSGSSRKLEIRRKLERELRVFLTRLNDLIDTVQDRLRVDGWHGLVAIVDGLEKMHYQELDGGQSSHTSLFVEHAEQLKAPHCHIIYTVPISLLFNVHLGDSFTDSDVIPMVKLRAPKTGKPFKPGVDALRKIIARRITIDRLFDNPQTIEWLIEASGGSIRDLMRLIRMACDETDSCIEKRHTENAIHKLVREYDRLVKDDDLPLLRKIAESRQIPGDADSGRLLHHRLVLEYFNDERWADLHPAVQRSPRVEKALAS